MSRFLLPNFIYILFALRSTFGGWFITVHFCQTDITEFHDGFIHLLCSLMMLWVKILTPTWKFVCIFSIFYNTNFISKQPIGVSKGRQTRTINVSFNWIIYTLYGYRITVLLFQSFHWFDKYIRESY